MTQKKRAPARTKPAVIIPALTPPRGSPFAGISKTGAPARETQIPHLTAQVQIAKARQERLNQGGLLTPEQRAQEQRAAKTLAKPEKRDSVTAPKRSARTTPSQSTPPLVLGAPPAALSAALPNSTPARTPRPPARRGAPTVLAGRFGAVPATKPTPGIDWGGAVAALGHGVDAAARRSAYHQAKLSQSIAGVGVQGAVPKNFTIPIGDLVGTAAAATGKKAITKDELARLEAQGVDLKPSLRTRFLKNAAKNGWNPAELDGLSGSALIDKAFTKPAWGPLRVGANLAGGVAKLGTLPAGIEGAVRETLAGHGREVGTALGEGLISEVPFIGKHKTTDTAVADPFGFITQFAGVGKTVGAAGRLGKVGNVAREVETASSGLKVARGMRDPNAYVATGQALSDKAAASISRIGRRLEAEVVDKSVRRVTNKHAPAFVKVQRPYKQALDKVGHKRAAELSGYQMSGGRPEQLAAFYRSQGITDNAAFFDKVAKNTKTLSKEDRTFLDAHVALANKTTEARGMGTVVKTKTGKDKKTGGFSSTASEFRRYSPLIRSAAHLGDPDAQSLLKLRDGYLKNFNTLPDEELEAARGAIDYGVEQFAQRHIKNGGIEPVYVQYSQPRPLIAPPYKPGPGGATGFKKPRGRQKAETGASFESGKYLIDPKAPLMESVRAQRAHLADVLHEDVSKSIGQHLTAGDPIPHGHVFVSETNLRGLRRTTNDLTDNPVSAPAYDEFASQQQGIFDRLTGAAVPSGERVPRGQKGYAIPEGAWRRILDHTRPPSRSAWDKSLKKYQQILISYRPSTIFNNTIGSMPLAMTGGAVTPRPWVKAAQAMRDPSLSPAVLRGRGVAGSLAPGVRSKTGAGMDFMRAQSQRGEDFSRLATYFAKAGPTLKKRARELEMSADDYQRALAAGEVDPQRLDAFLDHAEKFVGDVARPDGPIGRFSSHGIMFHRWLGHMAKLILYTLPVKHPRRLAILNALADYGDQYRQEKGVWPEWYREYLPLFQSVKRVGKAGVPQVFTKAYSTQGFNPYSTLNQYANPINSSDLASGSFTEAVKGLALGVAAPPIQVVGRTIFDRPGDSTDAGRYFLGQTLRQVPGVSVVRPQSGMSSDSIPFFSERQKQYAGKKPGTKLPYDFRPTARPQGGVLGALLRYGIGGVYDVPAQGPVHSIDTKKHIGAVAADARKARRKR